MISKNNNRLTNKKTPIVLHVDSIPQLNGTKYDVKMNFGGNSSILNVLGTTPNVLGISPKSVQFSLVLMKTNKNLLHAHNSKHTKQQFIL